MPGPRRTVTVVVALLAGLAGCGATDQITVAVASSITEPLEIVGDAALSPAGSQTIAAQVRSGAPLDAVVVANEVTALALADDGLIDEPVEIARTRLGIAVAAGNPLHLTDLGDLTDPGLRLVAADDDVPLGRYTQVALAGAGVRLTLAARQASAAAVITAVAVGEADAAVVYATQRADGVDVVVLDDVDVVARYFAAVVTATDHPDEAAAWVAAVVGDEGRRALREHGYELP